jgi:hypothetical protein
MLRFRFGFAPLIALFVFSNAQTISARQGITSTPPLAGFSGDWVETKLASGPPMRLRFSQNGSQVTVWLTYSETFSDRVFGMATIKNGVATWAAKQTCAEQFQSPGFDYSNAGRNTFALSFVQPEGQTGPVLVFTQVTEWNAPCGGHKIGTEGRQTLLLATN